MGSPTQISDRRRKIRKAAAGMRRKTSIRIKGSIPHLPLDKPNANEIKQKRVSAAPK